MLQYRQEGSGIYLGSIFGAHSECFHGWYALWMLNRGRYTQGRMFKCTHCDIRGATWHPTAFAQEELEL